MERFDSTVKNMMSVVDNNEYLSAALSVLLVVYAGVVAPKLPEYVIRFFDNPIFKLLVFFLIAYNAKKNPTVAIISAVALMVTLHTLQKYDINRKMAVMVAQEEAASRPQMMAPRQRPAMMESHHEGMDPSLSMEEGSIMADHIDQEALAELQEVGMPPQVPGPALRGCSKQANYRNSFYPQYANMKPDAYMARYSGNDIAGFDSTAKYASI